ncbi:IF-2B-domain-containing protein [Cylindrobasidium torrendii FP15055 ss-10]|uniref:Translation initiation factor eIF2B subunit alpha n=1 Tax=Cylindrobasidium torrendii FP15055 ss-10 TaxID=1314674 RepID=A0A0D7B5Y6_9AGAR|nr:IF-2B-domain-containing protein [Cylindrobasidium torrendii FP15055 ss-10]
MTSTPFDVCSAYEHILEDENISTPLASILALVELMENSAAGTMFELVKELKDGAEALKRQSSNSISLSAGTELFIEFVTLFPHDASSFLELKSELIRQGHNYVTEALSYRQKIADLAFDFIKDGSIILTHSYSRVVMQTLLWAHKRKRISVFVTEARPRGLGIKTAEKLTAAGIPSTVILDSAVAYTMNMVDLVLVGSEAVVESGGLVNAVGSNQIAIIAKAMNKPFYALAESYKFHRLFPLSQYDLPTHNSQLLSFSLPQGRTHRNSTASRARPGSNPPVAGIRPSDPAEDRKITQEQIARNNPDVDYTRPDLISLVFSDVGSLTPEGVSQYLVGMFAG